MYNSTSSPSPALSSTVQFFTISSIIILIIIFTFSFSNHLELLFGLGHFIPFDALDVNNGILALVEIVR